MSGLLENFTAIKEIDDERMSVRLSIIDDKIDKEPVVTAATALIRHKVTETLMLAVAAKDLRWLSVFMLVLEVFNDFLQLLYVNF